MENFHQINSELLCGVFATFRFVGRPPTRSEVDEYLQEAWLRYLSTPEEQDKPFLCGRRATANAIRRWSRRQGTKETRMSEQQENVMAECQRKEPMPSHMVEELIAEFQQQRRKGGNRGLFAAARDVAILNLLWQGYSDLQITTQLDMPYRSLRTYRRQIKERLSHMLQRKENPGKQGYMPAWASGNSKPQNYQFQ